MKLFPSLLRALPFVGHCALILFGIVALYAVPPARGRMLLLPMTQSAKGALASVAIAHGARLVAKGPWPGSLVVEGSRAVLAPAMLGRGVVALSTRIGGCAGATR